MATLPASSAPANPPARHGTCRLTLTILDTTYALRPHPHPRPQCRCWILRAVTGPRPGRIYSVAVDGTDTACSCPDAARGVRCKHIGALAALGLLEVVRPAPAPRAAVSAASLRRHRPELPAPGPPPEDPIYTDPVAMADGFRAALRARVAVLAAGAG